MHQCTRRKFLELSLYSAALTAIVPQTLNAKSGKEVEQLIFDRVKALKPENGLTLRVLFPEGSLPNIQVVANNFTAGTGVEIAFSKAVVDDINTRILIEHAAKKQSFDVALPATFGLPDLVEAEALADLTAYAKIYEPQIGYKKSLYNLGDRYKDKFYGYQTDGDAYIMFYNKNFFENTEQRKRYEDKFSQKLTIPETWKQLDQVMQFFHDSDQGRFGGCMFRTSRYVVWEWWIRAHAKGMLPFAEDMSANINSDAGVAALEDLVEATAYQHPACETHGLFDNWKEFASGHSAVNIGWGGTQKYIQSDKSKIKGQIQCAATPEVSYFNWGWNYVAAAGSAYHEIAYLFGLYATLPEQSTQAVKEDGFFDPFRIEHYDDSDIQEIYGRDFLEAHKSAIITAIPDFYIQGHGDYIQALQENILLTDRGDITAKQALDFTANTWNMLTEELGVENQKKQWQFLKSKYPKHIVSKR